QSGPAAAEVLDAQSLERDLLGPAVEGERLDDAIVGDVVEAAVEAVLLPVGPDVDEGPGSPGASVPVLDAGGELRRAHPLRVELGVCVGAQELRRGGAEVAGDADQRDLGV